MKILDSFIADNVEKKITVRLLQVDMAFPVIMKHICLVEVVYEKVNILKYIYFTKFFAMRKYNQIKNGYKSCWLEYSVYEVNGGDVK